MKNTQIKDDLLELRNIILDYARYYSIGAVEKTKELAKVISIKWSKLSLKKKVISILVALGIATGSAVLSTGADTVNLSKSLIKDLEEQGYDLSTEELAYLYGDYEKLSKKDRKEVKDVYVDVKDNHVDDKELEKLITEGHNIGLIVEPTDYTYSSIYQTIDYIKALVSKYNIKLGIYYDISKYIGRDDTRRANALLGAEFVLKLEANGIYAGFIGTNEELEKFTFDYQKHNESHSIDLSDKIVVCDKHDKADDLDGVYHSVADSDGRIVSNFDMDKTISNAKLNDDEDYIEDFVYTVRRGDTLYGIAQAFNLKTVDLATYNNMDMGDTLIVGTKLVIPNQYAFDFSDYQEYIVKSGDKLISIANKFGVSFTDLVRFNHIIDEDKIYVGQTLKIPVVKSHDNKTDTTATKNENDAEEIINSNGMNIVKGIDVSSWQGKIDWERVSEQVDFAIVKYSNNMRNVNGQMVYHKFFKDSQADANIKGCKENGVPYGLYVIAESLNYEENMKYYKDVVRDLIDNDVTCDLPIYLDFEQSSVAKSGITDWDGYVTKAKGIFEAAGYKVSIYINSSDFNKFSKITCLNSKDFWITCPSTYNNHYNYSNFGKDGFELVYFPDSKGIIKQYTQYGKIDGINGNVDFNVASASLIKDAKKSNTLR